MEIIWKQVDSYQDEQPGVLDITSSQIYVYLRRNIEQTSRTDEMSGEEIEYWTYEEAKLTKEEYERYSETLIYQTLVAQSEAMDSANAMLMLSQANIEAAQAGQEETLSLVLENTLT